jgi:hypothetical protein
MRTAGWKGNAGYLPFVAVGIGAGTGGWIASLLGAPEWTLAIPGMIVGYFASRAILRRVYSDDE